MGKFKSSPTGKCFAVLASDPANIPAPASIAGARTDPTPIPYPANLPTYTAGSRLLAYPAYGVLSPSKICPGGLIKFSHTSPATPLAPLQSRLVAPRTNA